MTKVQLYSKISYLPAELKQEMNDYIDFLISKSQKETKKNRPKFGSANGKIVISEDFDEPLEDFKEYM